MKVEFLSDFDFSNVKCNILALSEIVCLDEQFEHCMIL